MPVIIYYHYNTLETEPMSCWWSSRQKQKFYNMISQYNIKMIINGHHHKTKYGDWRGIPYVVCGNEPVIVEINGDVCNIKN